MFSPGVAELRAAASDDDRILLMSGPNIPSMRDCYRAADAYLSLHRGEGFGLNIAEALMQGIPAVATAYSINDEFLAHPLFRPVGSRQIEVVDPQHHYDIVPGATWADPDIREAADLLRQVYTLTLRRGLP